MNTNDDDEIFARELLSRAGAPPEVPEEDLAEITTRAREVWEERYASRHTSRWLLPLAATVLIAAGLASWMFIRRPVASPPPAPVLVASVEHTTGSLALRSGQSLFSGAIIETDSRSRAELRLAGGQSLRLDAGTRARLESPVVVELQRGGLYVDSMQPDTLTIRTEAGLFNPIGTQFEVRVDGRTTRLRVREGRVAFDAAHAPREVAAAGEELSIISGDVDRGSFRADDAQWQWVVEAARIPPIEGRTLEWFLRWCAREKGWKLEYASRNAAARAASTILHGSVDDLTLEDALRSVALSSGVQYRIDGGTLVIDVG